MTTFLDTYMQGIKPITDKNFLYPFASPKDNYYGLHSSWTEGGVDIENTSEGLFSYKWLGNYYPSSGEFIVYRSDKPNNKTKLFTIKDILSVDFCFDQNMRPFISFEKNYESFYWHFNPETSKYDEVRLKNATRFPRCILYRDNEYSIPDSDILIAYLRENVIYTRVQRERFLQERTLWEFNKQKYMLWKIGLGKDSRFLFQVR